MNQEVGQRVRPGWSWHVLPALLYLVFAFVTGSLPGDPMGAIHFDAKDKVIHLLGFWLMEWTHARAWRFRRPDWRPNQVLLWSFASATGAGGALELWQALLPHRSADVLDWAADAVGALLGAGFSWWVQRAAPGVVRDQGPLVP